MILEPILANERRKEPKKNFKTLTIILSINDTLISKLSIFTEKFSSKILGVEYHEVHTWYPHENWLNINNYWNDLGLKMFKD